MIPILYESNESAFQTQGLGTLVDCLSCVVTEERNGTFECEFTYPINGRNFDLITPGRIIYCWHDETKTGQPFDIVGYTKPLDGVVTFRAVHVSYRLTEYVTRAPSWAQQTPTMFFNSLFSSTYTEPTPTFNFWTDIDKQGYVAAADGPPKSVRSIMGGMEGSVLDAFGGEYEFDRFLVRLWENRGRQTNQTIRYGVNLAEYNDDTSYLGTYSAVIPYWTGTDANGNEEMVVGDKVESSVVTYNGRQAVVALDLTEKLDPTSVPTKAQVESAAANYLLTHTPWVPAKTISVDFVNLAEVGEFEEYRTLLTCRLCDQVRVVFPAYKMDANYKIVKTTYNVLTERYEGMELGHLSTTLAEALGVGQVSSSSSSGGSQPSQVKVDAIMAKFSSVLDLTTNVQTIQFDQTSTTIGENITLQSDGSLLFAAAGYVEVSASFYVYNQTANDNVLINGYVDSTNYAALRAPTGGATYEVPTAILYVGAGSKVSFNARNATAARGRVGGSAARNIVTAKYLQYL